MPDDAVAFAKTDEEGVATSKRRAAFDLTERIENPFDLYLHLPYRIAVVSNLLLLDRDSRIKSICPLGPREMRVLLNIGSYMPIAAADIAYQSRMDSYTISRAVRSLREQELLETEDDPTNRRTKYLVLTTKGLDLYRRLSSELEERGRELESVLDESDKEELFRILRLVEDKIEGLLAGHALKSLSDGNPLTAGDREIIRWYKRGTTNEVFRTPK